MKVLGLIPARGGSQRTPRKNIADLGGKPLIEWAIRPALSSNIFHKLVVSTDDVEIAALASKIFGGNPSTHIHRRPPDLAKDSTPMLPVVKDALETHACDVVILLQPTSPFRTKEDIINVHNMLVQSGGDAVISVTDAPSDLVFELGHAKRLRPRADIVVPNGAIYAITADALDRGEDWYSGISYAYKMPKERSLDIDTPLDLEIARMMLKEVAYGLG